MLQQQRYYTGPNDPVGLARRARYTCTAGAGVSAGSSDVITDISINTSITDSSSVTITDINITSSVNNTDSSVNNTEITIINKKRLILKLKEPIQLKMQHI